MSDQELETATESFLAHINKIFNEKPSVTPTRVIGLNKSIQWSHLVVQEFRKDYRNPSLPDAWTTTSIYCFVARMDNTGSTMGSVFRGGIYKPASFSKPAKHCRGSVFDRDSWGCAGRYGIASIR